jgi:hypothetical protein
MELINFLNTPLGTLLLLVVLFVLLFIAYRYLPFGKGIIRQMLKLLVDEAERQFGSKQGVAKFKQVCDKMPPLFKLLLPEQQLRLFIDKALDDLQLELDQANAAECEKAFLAKLKANTCMTLVTAKSPCEQCAGCAEPESVFIPLNEPRGIDTQESVNYAGVRVDK